MEPEQAQKRDTPPEKREGGVTKGGKGGGGPSEPKKPPFGPRGIEELTLPPIPNGD